jgi:acyl carrier protein
MSEEEIKNRIFLCLKEIAPDTEPSELQPNENLRQSLNLDSFDFLHFITALDEKLGFTIPEEDYGKITTLGTLMAYIKEKR